MSAPSTIIRLLAVAIAAVVALTLAPAPAISAPTAAETKYGNKVFSIVNNIRANHDRVVLKRNKCLQRFANRQAERMANQRRLFHSQPGPVMTKCGLTHWAENVAFHPGSPRAVVRAWMNSTEGHRENILGKKYRITGVAARKAGGYWWVAQVFGRKG